MQATLPAYKLKKRVFVLEHPFFFNQVWKECAPNDVKFVGLDCEFEQRNVVGLIQLTGPTGTVLVHVARFPGMCLESPTTSAKLTHVYRRPQTSRATGADTRRREGDKVRREREL